MKLSHAALPLALSFALHVTAQEDQVTKTVDATVLKPSLVRHYERVEQELLQADVSHLTDTQRQERQRAIAALRAYRERGEFGVNEQRPEERRFLFIDEGGRRCAVAHLLDVWGQGHVTQRVAEHANGALVVELAGDPELQRFLNDLGLSTWEAARIQGPSQRSEPPPPSWDGPGDTVPRPPRDIPPAPATPSTPSLSAPPAVTPTPRGTAVSAGAAQGTPRGMAITIGAPETWEVWWNWNRLGFLDRTTSFGKAASPITPGIEGDGDTKGLADMLRQRAEARILPWLHHDEPRLRVAALFALGEFGSSQAIPAMLDALTDAHRRVREEALLALGHMALPRSVHALLTIANHGTLRQGDRELRFTEDERALAIAALAIAERRGFEAPIGASLEHLLRREAETHETTIAAADLVHTGLSPDLVALARARQLAARDTRQLATRVQAVRSLAVSRDGESLATLVRTLADPHLDVRIASALALAGQRHDLALPSLMTAYEVEREQRTRGMLLLAIGEHGTEAGRSFLVNELEKGPRSLRPFAALGLGLLARADASMNVTESLLRANEREKNRGAKSAYVIALGLARAESETLALAERAFENGSATERAYAGQALAFLGSTAAHERLTSQIAKDPCTTTRLSLAESLGYVPGADLDAITARIDDDAHDEWRHALARSLGWNGTSRGTARVLEALERESLDPKTRATYVEATGWMLSRHPETRPAIELTRHTHPDVFPAWMATAYQRAF